MFIPFDELSLTVTDYIPLALASVNHSLLKAEKYYRCSFPVGEVLFNLRGRAGSSWRSCLTIIPTRHHIVAAGAGLAVINGKSWIVIQLFTE